MHVCVYVCACVFVPVRVCVYMCASTCVCSHTNSLTIDWKGTGTASAWVPITAWVPIAACCINVPLAMHKPTSSDDDDEDNNDAQ